MESLESIEVQIKVNDEIHERFRIEPIEDESKAEELANNGSNVAAFQIENHWFAVFHLTPPEDCQNPEIRFIILFVRWLISTTMRVLEIDTEEDQD